MILLLYCDVDNERQNSSQPTNTNGMFSTKLRDHCSNECFCFFSASEALCGKTISFYFFSSMPLFDKFNNILFNKFQKVNNKRGFYLFYTSYSESFTHLIV